MGQAERKRISGAGPFEKRLMQGKEKRELVPDLERSLQLEGGSGTGQAEHGPRQDSEDMLYHERYCNMRRKENKAIIKQR
jgi:hypothetical protein